MIEINEDNAFKIFVKALFGLLKENEGVIIEYEGEKLIVGKTFNDYEWTINISPAEDLPDLKVGDKVWLHETEEEAKHLAEENYEPYFKREKKTKC